MMIYLKKKIINIDQLPKCEVCKPLSVHLHPTGACASAMCRVEFAALFIVPSLLTLAVCVPSNREPNSPPRQSYLLPTKTLELSSC